MDNESMRKNPEACIDCLKSVMLCVDKIDLFTATYEHMFVTFKDDKTVLRKLAEILAEETAYVYRLQVDRAEAGLIQGAKN